MHVAVDLDNLRFLYKHPHSHTVYSLGHLEANDVSLLYDNTERSEFLNKLSDLDIVLLYKNTTGSNITTVSGNSAREALRLIAKQLPVTDAIYDEVTAQLEAVEDSIEEGLCFKYVKGAKVPAVLSELFPLTAKPLDETMLQQSVLNAQQRAIATTACSSTAPAETLTIPPRARVRIVTGSVGTVVREYAEKVWLENGQFTDKEQLLKLRKRVMGELEEQHGITKTTASNYLGAWMKDKVK